MLIVPRARGGGRRLAAGAGLHDSMFALKVANTRRGAVSRLGLARAVHGRNAAAYRVSSQARPVLQTGVGRRANVSIQIEGAVFNAVGTRGPLRPDGRHPEASHRRQRGADEKMRGLAIVFFFKQEAAYEITV